jgi:polyhydroxyalkanoate synthesis regulator protein
MAEEGYSYSGYAEANVFTKLRDLEEKYRILKDRTLLIGQNLIDMKENSDMKFLEIKKDIEMLKNSMQRLTAFMETASEEFSRFAKKEDLDILYKQAKMFQPLDFVRKKDLKK